MRLVEEAGLQVEQRLRRGGSGYLRSRIPNFCQMASFRTVLVITDLDQARCPSQLLSDWLGSREIPPGLIVRVAVREIESWLLADHEAMRRLLGKRAGTLPREPELLPNPKSTLLNMARQAPRDVRDDLLPPEGAVASQGLGFNRRLGSLIKSDWSPARAADRAPSLGKARRRLRELAQDLHRD